jgi:hypothetical protein
MKKEFVIYEIALALKELGFDEECLGYYLPDEGNLLVDGKSIWFDIIDSNSLVNKIKVPLWQQAFKFISTKCDINNSNFSIEFNQGDWLVIEFYNDEIQNIYRNEAGLEKLIELCKK